jgi:hypothetical protein
MKAARSAVILAYSSEALLFSYMSEHIIANEVPYEKERQL